MVNGECMNIDARCVKVRNETSELSDIWLTAQSIETCAGVCLRYCTTYSKQHWSLVCMSVWVSRPKGLMSKTFLLFLTHYELENRKTPPRGSAH